MGGRGARIKGGRFELEVVKNLRRLGLSMAKKIPLSGASDGFPGDILTGLLGLRGECKWRRSGSGFRTLERWLQGNDIIFLRRDGEDPYVAMPWKSFALIAHHAATGRIDEPDGYQKLDKLRKEARDT